MSGSWGARKPIRVKLKLSVPEIKAELLDENTLAEPNTPNIPADSSPPHPDHILTPPPARTLASRRSIHPDPKQSRTYIPRESDISALDIGPRLTRSQLQPVSLPRIIQPPLAARTGFMRSIPVAARSRNSEAVKATENVQVDFSDRDSEVPTSDNPSISPESFSNGTCRCDEMYSIPNPFDIRCPQPILPVKFRRYDIEELEAEAVTFSSIMSINPEVFHQERRRNLVLRLLERRPRVWKRTVIRDSDFLGLGYGSGFDVDLVLSDRHFHHAINLDPQTKDTSHSQPRSPQAVPPWNATDSYPDIYTAVTDDYNWSQEVHKRLKDDRKALDEREARLDDIQFEGPMVADDPPIEDFMYEGQIVEEF
ncbi:uncharacterized protein N7477_005320 [Penicillium maclennaniae]|uniref:uncharacterized protein n=1 Tax=Penicillium maclennaniae TaxID=1343394 RepID=UPI002540EBDE|nr:uncharacterized protein N7477_005320 [Penicillium maclennaniae]KAJ5669957.1 hypothetical protein N7477_005320 [Penicillium maclennaniae]